MFTDAQRRQRERLAALEQEEIAAAAGEAGTSAGLYGAALGGGGALLSGVRSPLKLALAALGVGALGGATAAGSTYLGSQMMGAPPVDEEAPFTKRAALGGAVGGGLLGAGAGALLASGKLKGLSKLPGIGKAWSAVEKAPPVNSLLGDWFKKLAASPGGVKKASALTGGVGALLGGYQGADEGMAVDAYRDAVKKKYMEMLANGSV